MFSSEHYEIFKNTYFEEQGFARGCFWFFKTATEQRSVAASVFTILLSSDNLLTGYQQLRYQQFNQNLSICGTKFAQKECFRYKTEKVNTSTEFWIFKVIYVPNFRLNWQFPFAGPNLPKNGVSGLK